MEKTETTKKTSVTFSGITPEVLELLNKKVTESGMNRADFLKNMLAADPQQAAEPDSETETKLAELEAANSELSERINAISRKYEICKKHFLIPDKLGVILHALISMGEAKSFSEAIDYILEPYWKQNKLVADENDTENYMMWKQKILSDAGSDA